MFNSSIGYRILIGTAAVTLSLASIRHIFRVDHAPLERPDDTKVYVGAPVTIATDTFVLGESVVPVVSLSCERLSVNQRMVLSVSGEATVFAPSFRFNSSDHTSISIESELAIYRSYTYIGPLKISTRRSGDFEYESEFTVVVERAFPDPVSNFLGILDGSLGSDFIRSVGGYYMLSTNHGVLGITIGEFEQKGFVFYPVIKGYNSFVIRGTLNEALMVDVLLDSTSAYGLTVSSKLCEFFTVERPPILHLDIIGYPFIFSQYTVVEPGADDDVVESRVVVLNPTWLRNFDIIFDVSGRVGFRKNLRDLGLLSV